jgi:hypothetical protein
MGTTCTFSTGTGLIHIWSKARMTDHIVTRQRLITLPLSSPTEEAALLAQLTLELIEIANRVEAQIAVALTKLGPSDGKETDRTSSMHPNRRLTVACASCLIKRRTGRVLTPRPPRIQP